MRWFSNARLAYRLAFGFGTLLASMIALAALGLSSMSAIEGRLDDVVKTNIYKLGLLTTMADSVHVVARVTRSMILLDEEPELMEQEYKKIVDARALYDKAWGELQKFPPSERAAKLRARSEEARRLSGELNDQVLALARARKTHEATTLLLKQAGPATTKWQEALHENIELQHETARHDEEASREAYVRARTWMLVLLGGSMAFGLLIAWLIVTSITRPLAEAVHVAQAVARGDLSRTVEVDREDEAGQLLRALKEMTTNLAATVSQVRNSAQELTSASTELSASAARVSHSSLQQSEAASGVAASVEEVTVSINSVSHNAEDVRGLAKTSLDKTEQGGSDMNRMVGEIGRIESAVTQIHQSVNEFMASVQAITGMAKQVKELAEQTNLLALNAAIEAARAGEQGRGFAVVADEVRKLSERSSQSATEIDAVTKRLAKQSADVEKAIGDGMASLGSSRGHVDAVVAVLAQAKDAVGSATRGVEDIATSVKEQTVATTDIAKHVERIARMAEENHASVTETTRAAQSLEQLAGKLQGAVTKFKLAS